MGSAAALSRASRHASSGRRRSLGISAALLAPMLGLALQGCITASRYRTNSEHSATEQLLVTTATDRAVEALAWPRLDGVGVSVQVATPSSAHAPYLKAAVQAWIGELGARIVPPGSAAETVAVLAGALGTEDLHLGVGLPSLPTPFGLSPPVNLLAYDRQRGYAKLRAVARDRSGATIGASPPVVGRSFRSAFRVLFFSFQRGDLAPSGEGP